MTIQLLESQLNALNGDARETARQLGDAALSVLLGRVHTASVRERTLVLECLAEIKSDASSHALVEALGDDEQDVWNTALDLLHTAAVPADAQPLTELLVASTQARIRGEVARILGRMGAESALPVLKEQAVKEENLDVVRKIELALARLEDGPFRRRIVDRLTSTIPQDRYDAIGDLEYVNDPKLMPKLLPLLDDKTQITNVGIEQWPVWHRVCDRALEAVAVLSDKPFSFPTGKRSYSKAEFQSARQRIEHHLH